MVRHDSLQHLESDTLLSLDLSNMSSLIVCNNCWLLYFVRNVFKFNILRLVLFRFTVTLITIKFRIFLNLVNSIKLCVLCWRETSLKQHMISDSNIKGKFYLLVTAMLISPVLGVSSPSCGNCDIPEVRRGSSVSELSLLRSPRTDPLLPSWPLVSLSMSKAILSAHGTFVWK